MPKKYLLAMAVMPALLVLAPGLHAQTTQDDSCTGTWSLLSVLDRPTVGDSVCVVPNGQVVIESGVQRLSFRDGSHGYSFPQAEFRFGVPHRNEFVFLPPSYLRTAGSNASASGFGAGVIGIKHAIGSAGKWQGAVESLFTLPSGSAVSGSRGLGAAFNGIVNYSPTENTGLSLMLGASTQTLPLAAGGGRYTSFNPDVVASWAPTNRLQFYSEIYGQSRTAPGQGFGWNVDGGVQYLLAPNVEVDAEIGYRLAGDLGGFNRYIGVGLGFRY